MAGDWIKMRGSLQTHPKVVTLMSRINCDKHTVIGALHAVWSVFDQHTEHGVLNGYTPHALDEVIGRQGFSEAMIAVGWMHFDGVETLTVPEFSEHNGASAKRRAEATKRKQNSRKSDDGVANMSRKTCDKSETREEKRREEDSVPKGTGADAPSSDESNAPIDPSKALWDLWVGYVGDTPYNRSMLAKLIAEHGESDVREAVAATIAKKPAEPIAYMRGCLKPRRRFQC